MLGILYILFHIGKRNINELVVDFLLHYHYRVQIQ